MATSTEQVRRWRREHPEQDREYKRRANAIVRERRGAVRDALLASQEGVCAVCGTDDPGSPNGWVIDHDHACCKTAAHARYCGRCDRGVLCHACNTILVPAAERGPELFQRALEYLS